ncbi:MAG: glycosyltransferase family 39 protein [Candidatus Altiarchaeota archaeon]|nr:glycosyltransferase family 39 protein [Candidatus Altiarchaeota archaeon]
MADENKGYCGGRALAAVLIAGLFLRLYIASLPMETMLPNLLSDDVFYYLKLAGNVAAGRPASFDGIEPTNGFHPLYALLLTVLYSLGGQSLGLDMPVRIALAALSVFDVLTGFVIYKILMLPAFGSNRNGALLGCLFWTFNPFVISGTFYGLETALAAFFISLVFYAYLRALESGSYHGYLSCGLLAGFALLARSDAVFLVAAVAWDITVRRNFKALLLFLSAAGLVYSPWLLWGLLNFGMFQQDSGAVMSYVNGVREGGFLSQSYMQAKFSAIYLTARILAMFAASIALPIALLLLMPAGRKILRGGLKKSAGSFIVWYCVLLLAYYALVLGGGTRRYYHPLLIVAALFAGLVYSRLSSASLNIRKAFAVLLLFNLLFAGWFYWWYRPLSPQAWHSDLYDAALWIGGNTKPGDRIGGFNSGIVGYYSGRTVTNLDGVINHNAYLSITNRCLYAYIRESDIAYLVDNLNTFPAAAPFMGKDDYMSHLKVVYKKPLRERPGEYVVVYEVVD